MSYLFKNIIQSDKICFGTNDLNESWQLLFFKRLRNEIIKSGENALGDFDWNSQMGKTYMENREDYQ